LRRWIIPREAAIFYKYVVVAAIAVSPVGEELVSIPVGYFQGLPLFSVALVSVIFNFLPVPIILLVVQTAEKHPWVQKALLFFRREKVLALAKKYGFWGVAFLSPITGVYSMAVCAWVLGIGRARINAYIFVGLVAYAVATSLSLLGGAKLLSRFL
jgi:uncharacterized membrane protein